MQYIFCSTLFLRCETGSGRLGSSRPGVFARVQCREREWRDRRWDGEQMPGRNPQPEEGRGGARARGGRCGVEEGLRVSGAPRGGCGEVGVVGKEESRKPARLWAGVGCWSSRRQRGSVLRTVGRGRRSSLLQTVKGARKKHHRQAEMQER